MRRRVFSVLAGVCLLLACPTQADAWWGWIDELTGPKGFHGPQLDVRLVCFPKPDFEPESVGFKLSFCSKAEERQRIFAVTFGGRLFYATDNSKEFDPTAEEYANGHRMYLFTAVPMGEVRPAAVVNHFCKSEGCRQWSDVFDIVDVAAGLGYYRISSDGFNPLQGKLYEWRATIRLPVALTQAKEWARFIPQFAVGEIGFAGGFEANAFGPQLKGSKADPIHEGGTDWTPQYAIFMDLTPFLK